MALPAQLHHHGNPQHLMARPGMVPLIPLQLPQQNGTGKRRGSIEKPHFIAADNSGH